MKLNIECITNLKDKEVQQKVRRASEKALKKVVIDIANDVVKGSPVKTGNNRRSIGYEVEGLSGSCYGTSGYSGYLEVGTKRRPATPYFRPALDKHIGELPQGIKAELE
jgi:HK97 gp10 family phage protein